MATRRKRILLSVLGGLVVVVLLVVLLWDWNWFKPIVEAKASAAIGRKVTIGRLHVSLGRVTEVTADDVTIANPPDFQNDKPFAKIAKLTVDADAMAYLHTRQIVLPHISLDQPDIEVAQQADGKGNFTFDIGSSDPTPASKPETPEQASSSPKIGDLVITDGQAHVTSAKFKTDVALAIKTVPGGDEKSGGSQIEVDAKGTYASQPITGKFLGGALLSLRDDNTPYPINLQAQNGSTRISLVGTIQDPIKFAGANLKLELSGEDMSNLYPLTSIPIPRTPPYRIAGNLDYADHKIQFKEFSGRVGSSDLEGDISVDPGHERSLVIADLRSKRVDLADLGGFIGATPGRTATPGETGAQRTEKAQAEASPKLLPTTPISMPKLNAADVRLKYKGGHIAGESMPLDNVVVDLDITDGNITLKPLSFGVGRGRIASDISLAQAGKNLRTKAKIDFQQVDVSRLMASTHLFHGAGTIGGSATIDSTGDSVATILGNGNGAVRLYMAGGDLSAILVDLSGFEFGNAILSALGIPRTAQVRCMIADMGLERGVLNTRLLAIDTTEADVHGTGTIDFKTEALDYQIKTEAVHFTIGSIPAPIDVNGTFRHPSIKPDPVKLGVRLGAAVGLGVLFPPLALLPTIQLGLGEKNDCEGYVNRTAKK